MINNYQLDQETSNAIQSELEPNENILWSGKPNPARMATATIPIAIFGLFWTGFQVFFDVGWFSHVNVATNIGFVIMPALMSLLFWAIGLGMLSSPLVAYRKAAKIIYTVTDKRILILYVTRVRRVESYYPGDLGNIQRIERSDGSGDLAFAQKQVFNNNRTQTQNISFIGIPKVRDVESLVRTTLLTQQGNPNVSGSSTSARIEFR